MACETSGTRKRGVLGRQHAAAVRTRAPQGPQAPCAPRCQSPAAPQSAAWVCATAPASAPPGPAPLRQGRELRGARRAVQGRHAARRQGEGSGGGAAARRQAAHVHLSSQPSPPEASTSVRMLPGPTALTRILCGASASAMHFVKLFTPPLLHSGRRSSRRGLPGGSSRRRRQRQQAARPAALRPATCHQSACGMGLPRPLPVLTWHCILQWKGSLSRR